jgi:PAS domain-containing protein
MPDRPTIIVTADGAYSDANASALELLGVTLDEFRASSPGRFSVELSDPDAEAAFREQWEAAGRPDVGGSSMIRRADGSQVRVKFAIREVDDGTYMVLLTPVPVEPGAPAALYTAGEVLAAWRAAERRLEAVSEDAPERHEILEDIAEFRQRYQLVFQRGVRGSGAGR